MASKWEFVDKKGGPAMPAMKKYMREIKKEIADKKLLLLVKSEDLARQSAHYMAQRIRQMTKRQGSTGKLADALETNVIVRKTPKANFIIDVGDTDFLEAEAPYWAMINYGGYIKSGPVYGFWEDTPDGKSDYAKRGGAGKSTFVKLSGGNMMVPRKPIKGFQYIAYAHAKMSTWVNRFSI